ncbi:variable large family protein (plasmid) [Borrelia coriaceae]|uniref:Variable large protein n=1 Tax=Borrelia coriaceae ATCC 43381 TaxID=1408429 RepID=W5SW71_9SPIR|nr:variable large family protein [Borrelia coriaceae]AHH11434.1 Variable outer membrane protein [Borrelia coriaceae ATCC 43381]UPA17410.1 variable large family protein [Borrelia coriaceae]
MKINIKNINIKSICATLFISLFLSCNNGIEELEKRNTFLSSLANLGNDFLNIFTSFGDSFGGVLGFNTETKKSDVGAYFKKVQDAVQGTKDKLNNIVTGMKNDNNPNAASVETAVNNLVTNIFDKIIKGAKTAGEAIGSDSNLIANVADQNAGAAGKEIDNLVEGIKGIVGVVLENVGKPDAGDTNGPVQDNGTAGDTRTGSSNDNAGKLFARDNAGAAGSVAAKVARDASKAVSAVTGADILQAMVKDGGKAANLAKNTSDAAASVSAAAGANDATIAGAIALRAMAKDGKFSGPDSSKANVTTTVKRVAVSAVIKALNILTIAIRKTLDEGLKTVKDAMKINASDTTVSSEAGVATK